MEHSEPALCTEFCTQAQVQKASQAGQKNAATDLPGWEHSLLLQKVHCLYLGCLYLEPMINSDWMQTDIPSAGVMSPVLRLQTKAVLMLSDKSEWAQGSWEHLLLLLKETWIGNTQTTLELPFPHREVSPHISQAGAACRTSLQGLFSCDWGRQLSPKYLKLLKTQNSLDRSHC